MATIGRRPPLTSRTLSLTAPAIVSPLKTFGRAVSGATKRPRSPEPDIIAIGNTIKRAKAVGPRSPAIGESERKAKEQKRAERELQKAEFRAKYTKAFPSWSFYFDLDHLDGDESARELLETKISHLGGHIEDFFSSEITHLITNQSLPQDDADKENKATRNFHNSLVSPIKLGARAKDTPGFDLVEKAQSFGIKVWNTSKLESVLQRCLTPTSALASSRATTVAAPTPTCTNPSQRSLSRLLESERLHGATTERDPTQKRHDYRYFSKSSCFVLVEDIRGELATIAALEYSVSKGRIGDWPVLHCHPHARGPFIEFDEKEKKRWLRLQKAEKEKALEKEEKLERMRMRQEEQKRRQAQAQARKSGDLRRSVSMNNLHRQGTHLEPALDGFVDLDADCCDNPDSANASGYLASTGTGGYLAASGNSMGITSTTGTTSTAGLRSLQLPASLRGRIQQQVVTSRKFHSRAGAEKQNAGTMGPPVGIPERPTNALLRKSRSTNTLKLERHEEGCKPGYCESCRVKFDDFKNHIVGRKHRKFAVDDSNFLQLDFVLARVQRRTTAQVEEENQIREARRCGYDEDGDEHTPDDPFLPQSPQDLTPRQRQVWLRDSEEVMLEEM